MPYERACARFPLTDPCAAAESTSARSRQIVREIDRFRERYGTLRPSMTIACDRAAYAPLDPSDGELRVTFDTDLAFCDRFVRHASARPLLAPGEAVMEVKNAGPLPLWLTRALSGCQAYPSSFSKYGEAYRACWGEADAKAREGRPDEAASAPPVRAAHYKPTMKERVLDCA